MEASSSRGGGLPAADSDEDSSGESFFSLDLNTGRIRERIPDEFDVTPSTILQYYPEGPPDHLDSLEPIPLNFPGAENVIRFRLSELETCIRAFEGQQIATDTAANRVCKGRRNDQEIFVKSYEVLPTTNVEQWVAEIKCLSMPIVANHPNIIPLIGYCQTNQRLLLVYPWMPLGSVRQRVTDAQLTWKRTLQILRGTAEAIKLLHSQSPPLIHGDVKLPNILLDENWNPWLCDFGTCGPAGEGSFVAYTAGYGDPASLTAEEANTYSDIFSLGISILQLIMREEHVIRTTPGEGQQIHASRYEDQSILNWAWSAVQGGSKHVVADCLMQGEGGCGKRTAKKITKLALSCVEDDTRKRPDIDKVMKKLRKLDRPSSFFRFLRG